MLRVSVYHWIPIADNMLPEINSAIVKMGFSSGIEKDSVEYDANYTFKLEKSANNSVKIHGKINQRGFSQVTLDLYPITGMTLSSILNDIVPNFVEYIVSFLLLACPFAVRNKFAVIYEGIVSFQEFETVKFEPQITQTATVSMKKHSIVSILVDEAFRDEIQKGFEVPSLKIKSLRNDDNMLVLMNTDRNCLFMYSSEFSKDELYRFDGAIYKYCALLTYEGFVSRVIQLLKDTRDHVIPLRRQLAIALQRRTEEYLDILSRTKKYITYVNIKLPVINKVLNHLNDALESKQFKAKINTFSPEKISSYPTIEYIHDKLNDNLLKPSTIIGQIDESAGRLQKLFTEIEKEVNQFSSELSLVLSGSFLSENVQKLTKATQTLRDQLEVARSGKNRENALMYLSILLFANFGALIFRELNFVGLPLVIIAISFAILALIYIRSELRNKGSYFQIEIPVNKNLSRQALRDLTEQVPIKSFDAKGRARQKTWQVYLYTDRQVSYKSLINGYFNPNKKTWFMKIPWFMKISKIKEFDLSLEYEKHGYVHSIILETEHSSAKFDLQPLVFQIVYLLQSARILEFYDMKETSLYVELLTNLDIFVDRTLQGLNFILTVSSDELRLALNSSPGDNMSLIRDDTHIIKDIHENSRKYLGWLIDKGSKNDIDKLMFGEHNLLVKIEIISKIIR